MNYWLHRITNGKELSLPLLEERGILSVGWSHLSEEKLLEQCVGNREKFEEWFLEKDRELPRNRRGLWCFISEMKKGDLVLVPTRPGEFSIYTIADNKPFSIEKLNLDGLRDWDGQKITVNKDGCLCRPNEKTHIDIGFFRKVKPIVEEIPKDDYADQALTSKMKNQWTNFDISAVKDSIENIVRAFKGRG